MNRMRNELCALLERYNRIMQDLPSKNKQTALTSSLEKQGDNIYIIMKQINHLIDQAITPMVQVPRPEDIDTLIDLAENLYNWHKHINRDMGLSASIYSKLNQYAIQTQDIGLQCRCLYWLALYYRHFGGLNNKTALNYLRKAAGFLPVIQSIPKQNERYYLIACCVNLSSVMQEEGMIQQGIAYIQALVPQLQQLATIKGLIEEFRWTVVFSALKINKSKLILSGIDAGLFPAASAEKVVTLLQSAKRNMAPLRKKPGVVTLTNGLMVRAQVHLGQIQHLQAAKMYVKFFKQCKSGHYEGDQDATSLNYLYLLCKTLNKPLPGLDDKRRLSFVKEISKKAFGIMQNRSNEGKTDLAFYYLQHYIQCCESCSTAKDIIEDIVGFTALQHPSTCTHTIMVTKLSICIATSMLKLYPDFFNPLDKAYRATQDKLLEFVRLNALSHDIGKIVFFDIVGQSARRLTDEEFSLIKMHPATGYRLLQGFDLTRPYSYTALLHHGHYDGKGGYPPVSELPPEAIHYVPVAAIVAAADAIDAATDPYGRYYAKVKTLSAVIEEIVAGSGRTSHPRVAALLQSTRLQAEIQQLLNEQRPLIHEAVYKKRQLDLGSQEKDASA